MNGDRAQNDQGFTLIEMLVSITITAIILTVLTASFLVFFNNAAYTTGRDDHAAGASVLASWLNRDLASATLDTPPVINNSSVNTCTTPKTLLSVSWQDYRDNPNGLADSIPQADPASAVTVQYQYVHDTASNQCMLQRVANGAAPQELVHNLVSADLSTTATAPNGNNCPNTDKPLSVTLKAYHTSTASDAPIPYTYFGCINARTNGLPLP